MLQEAAKTSVGAPLRLRHVPQGMAGPGLAVPAHPSGPSLLSGRGCLAPPAQERRWGYGHGCRAQDASSTSERWAWGWLPPCPAAPIPASTCSHLSLPASCLPCPIRLFPPLYLPPSFCPLAPSPLQLPLFSPRLPYLLSTFTPVAFLSSGSRETLTRGLKVKPENEVFFFYLSLSAPPSIFMVPTGQVPTPRQVDVGKCMPLGHQHCFF